MNAIIANCFVEQKSQRSISCTHNFVLGSVWEQIFATHVFSFLSTYDLCTASNTCIFFLHTSQVSHIWIDLVRDNFSFPYNDSEINVGTVNYSDNRAFSNITSIDSGAALGEVLCHRNSDISAIITVPHGSSAKEKYALRLQDRNSRYQQAKERAILTEIGRVKERKQRCVQTFLDITLFRILVPLPLTALFLSIVLFTLHFDGSEIPIWACAAPLMFYFVYLLVFSVIASVVYKQRSDASSILYGLWVNVRGPIKTFYTETLQGSTLLVVCAVMVTCMCLLQIIFVAIKLSPSAAIESVTEKINWGLVFLPTWILFVICPLLGCLREPAVLFLGFILIWVPLFVIIVCLTVKLNGQQNNVSTTNIRMAYVFLPFWIIEGSVMVGTLIFLLVGIHSRRLGLVDRLVDHMSFGIFFATWFLFGPFVIFQALICTIDDNKTTSISHTESVIPILILIGWFFMCAIFFSVWSRTPFQDIQGQNTRNSAGSTVIFNV